MTRDQRIQGQLNAFIILGMLTSARDDMRAELHDYRARCQAQAQMRNLIAQSCTNGLPPRTALLLLNATIEQERTV